MSAYIKLNNVTVNYYLRNVKGVRKPERKKGKLGGRLTISKNSTVTITGLNKISLEITEGDRIGLIGLNGSGKTTFLKLCAGYMQPNSGEFEFTGSRLSQLTLNSGTNPKLTGRENVELACLYRGIPISRIKEIIQQAEEHSALGEFFDLPVSSYSSGMRSRLAMSFVAVLEGDIVLLDEWLGVGDKTAKRSSVEDEQANLVNNAKISIIASHNNTIIREWCNRVIWLHKGNIVLDDKTETVLEHYKNANSYLEQHNFI